MEDEINCLNCGSVNLEYREDFEEQKEECFCKDCKSTFPVEHDTRYAIADTGSTWYILEEEQKYRRIFFGNPTLEKITEISRLYSNLPAIVNTPAQLLPICKLCHDLLKERIRETLAYNQLSELSQVEKYNLSYDPRVFQLNIRKLVDEFIPKGLPTTWPSFQKKVAESSDLISELHWIRNKSEHIALTKWPTPSYVHTDLKRKPHEISPKILNKAWLKQTIPQAVNFLNEFQKTVGVFDENLFTVTLA